MGLFDSFDNLSQIHPEAIASWLKPVPQIGLLENYLANKILYPETIPQTERDMQIDLAIMREAVRINTSADGTPFLNTPFRKLLIPAKFLNFVPDLASLTWVFVDVLLLARARKDLFQDLWTIVLTEDSDEVVGSIILPRFEGSGGTMHLMLMNKSYEIQKGASMIIPCPKTRCGIAYRLQKGKVLGKEENAIEVYGGKLGLVVDARSL